MMTDQEKEFLESEPLVLTPYEQAHLELLGLAVSALHAICIQDEGFGEQVGNVGNLALLEVMKAVGLGSDKGWGEREKDEERVES